MKAPPLGQTFPAPEDAMKLPKEGTKPPHYDATEPQQWAAWQDVPTCVMVAVIFWR